MSRPKQRDFPDLSAHATDGALFHLRATPGARRNALEAQPDGTLRAWVRAPAEDGKANAAIASLLAAALGVAPSRIALIKGHSTRDKLFRLEF